MEKVIRYQIEAFNNQDVGDSWTELTIWPEYNDQSKDRLNETLDDATDEAWGHIIASTLADITHQHDLSICAYYRHHRKLDLLQRWWERIRGKNANFRKFVKYNLPVLTSDYIIEAEHQHIGNPVFLLTSRAQEKNLPLYWESDLANLLTRVEAMFTFGVEEAVLTFSFSNGEPTLFLENLRHQSQSYGHEVRQARSSFVSDWVVANPGLFESKGSNPIDSSQ